MKSTASWTCTSSGCASPARSMLLNFVVTLTASQFTPPPSDAVRAMVEELRLPREA